MTYLELVNNVLRRLREDEVSSVTESTYSKMVGDFVNDAKVLVESAHDWSALRTEVTVNTVEDTTVYSVTGSQDKIKELTVVNDTSNVFMEQRSNAWLEEKYLDDNPSKGSPLYFGYVGLDSSGDAQVQVYPKPDGVYSLVFNCILRNPLLVNNSDTLDIPNEPVMHMAIALLARERGETGGTSTPEYFGIADKYLSDAIALDAAKNPTETIWYTV